MNSQIEGVTFCAECGVAVTSKDVFCINCGSQAREIGDPPPEVQSRGGKFQTFLEEFSLKQAALNVNVGLRKKVKSVASGIRGARHVFSRWFASQIRWILPIAATLGVGLIYFATQQVITAAMGPDATLQKYVSAIKTGNFAALSDESLFPGSTALSPAEFRKAWTAAGVSEAHHEVTFRDGLSAGARINIDATSSLSYDVELSGSERWAFGFRIIDWRMDTPAPRVNLEVAPRLYVGQTVVFGSDLSEVTVGSLRETIKNDLSQSFSILPGVYTTKTSAAGFLKISSRQNTIWSAAQSESLLVDANDPILTVSQISAATLKAGASNRACARAKCGGMPRFKEADFDLWSQYTYSTYTSKSFSLKYSGGACVNSTPVVVAFNKINLDFVCSAEVKANLYVRYTYYYGYYSNYWYYWNLKDSKTVSTYPTVSFTANMDGSKIVRGAVRW